MIIRTVEIVLIFKICGLIYMVVKVRWITWSIRSELSLLNVINSLWHLLSASNHPLDLIALYHSLATHLVQWQRLRYLLLKA